MKAYVLHDIGDIRYEEVKDPVLKPDEVLMEVRLSASVALISREFLRTEPTLFR